MSISYRTINHLPVWQNSERNFIWPPWPVRLQWPYQELQLQPAEMIESL